MSIQESDGAICTGSSVPAPRRSSRGRLPGIARSAYHFGITLAICAGLTACGGGDTSDDLLLSASRACAGPVTGEFVSQCSVELRLAGTETLDILITGRMTAANGTDQALEVRRSMRIQAAGEGLDVQNVVLQLAAGQAGGTDFALRATVPAANLGGFPAVIGLSSLELAGASSVTDVSVQALAR